MRKYDVDFSSKDFGKKNFEISVINGKDENGFLCYNLNVVDLDLGNVVYREEFDSINNCLIVLKEIVVELGENYLEYNSNKNNIKIFMSISLF